MSYEMTSISWPVMLYEMTSITRLHMLHVPRYHFYIRPVSWRWCCMYTLCMILHKETWGLYLAATLHFCHSHWCCILYVCFGPSIFTFKCIQYLHCTFCAVYICIYMHTDIYVYKYIYYFYASLRNSSCVYSNCLILFECPFYNTQLFRILNLLFLINVTVCENGFQI